MNISVLTGLRGRFWRMLSVRWQGDPLASGSHLTGGRWNRIGAKALYLSSSHGAAIAEYHRAFVRPGTLIAYDVEARAIADLTKPEDESLGAAVAEALSSEWLRIADIEAGTPPGWRLADRLIEVGAEGALVPSVQNPGGTNLVLWRWGTAGGAKVRLIDPEGDLG
jgi:RES domain-containing protein